MNKEYILNKIKPYLDSKGMLREESFNQLFSKFSKRQQYKIINILIEENIDIDYNNAFNKNPINDNHNKKFENHCSIDQSLLPKLKHLSNEQLCVLYQQGYPLALETLVKKNKRLVWSRVSKLSKRYKHKLDEEDLLQYGTIGLIKAAKKFELKKEAKFTTYSIWWIDQQILRSIADYGFTIRIPVHYFDQVNRLMRIITRNPEYDKEELREEFGIDQDKFDEILIVAENILSLTSLNSIVGEDQDMELGDMIIDKTGQSVEEQVEYTLLKEKLNEILDTLTPREKDIINKRFGLLDNVERTLEQIGVQYGLTRERIRQIEMKAMKKLRKKHQVAMLKNYL